MATIALNSPRVVILDIRFPTIPVAELAKHQVGAAWEPASGGQCGARWRGWATCRGVCSAGMCLRGSCIGVPHVTGGDVARPAAPSPTMRSPWTRPALLSCPTCDSPANQRAHPPTHPHAHPPAGALQRARLGAAQRVPHLHRGGRQPGAHLGPLSDGRWHGAAGGSPARPHPSVQCRCGKGRTCPGGAEQARAGWGEGGLLNARAAGGLGVRHRAGQRG